MKIIILILIAALFTACNSTPKTAHINIPKLGEGETVGWRKNKNNMTFNTGKLDWHFHGSPVGKAWNYFFGKRVVEVKWPADIPVVPIVHTAKEEEKPIEPFLEAMAEDWIKAKQQGDK